MSEELLATRASMIEYLRSLSREETEAVNAATLQLTMLRIEHGVALEIAMWMVALTQQLAQAGLPPIQCDCPKCKGRNGLH